MRKVFLTADDFGRSPERNDAIDESFKKGLICSAGLMVTGKYLQDAVDHIKSGGYCSKVHCHFNLSGNIKGEDSEDTPLTERMKKDRTFCKDNKYRTWAGHPSNFFDIFKFMVVYKELVAQYDRFVEVTEGKGCLHHVDFHLYFNLTWPSSLALNIFTWTHKIKSVRYIGVDREHSKRRLFLFLSWNPFVKSYRSGNIDAFLSKPEWFAKDKTFELYCHPDYKTGVLMDNSASIFKHEKKSLKEHVDLLRKYDLEFVSWRDE